jgi:potassium/sodium efflux P-type ATPase
MTDYLLVDIFNGVERKSTLNREVFSDSHGALGYVNRGKGNTQVTSKEVMPDNFVSQQNPAVVSISTLSSKAVYAALNSHPQGLSQTEAEERLRVVGPNAIQETKGDPLYKKFLANFTHLMAILLWVGALVALIAQMPQLAIAIMMVNVINGAFSFWQEFRAEKATEALRKLLPSYARVIRDGEEQRIEALRLVPGDVVLLTEGDRISADCRLIQSVELRVDQSTLTGESRPVNKSDQPVLGNDISHTDIPNLIFAGTTVVAGSGKGVVMATGMKTEFGKIAQLTQTVGNELSPLQKEMESVTKIVTVLALAVGSIFFLIAVLMTGITFEEGFIFALGMIVAFVPEGLLPTVTLALAMGSQRMAKRHALIKKLSAVETLGCTTVICTDKTGTLTQNEMTVTDLWLSGQHYAASGIGYAPNGQIWPKYMDHPRTARSDSAISDRSMQRLLTAATLCNNARLLAPNGASNRWTILGDPTEAALKVVAAKGGVQVANTEHRYPRWHEVPFDSRRKRMSTVHILSTGDRLAFVKGAPKEILELCTQILFNGTERILNAEMRGEIMAANDDYARRGLRVLAIAERNLPYKIYSYTAETVENDLVFLGLVAMTDPPRPEVAEAVEKCHHAGIRVVMITGDYGLTAESIARKIGIVKSERPRILTGFELDGMDEAALKEAFQDEVIFARVAPEHKLRVVSTLQSMGQIVAVTGDGVNDAPALKKADIGVAMGLGGTDVAKEAADMILTDDNFASIVNAVEEGRAVYANIKKFTTYIFTSNTPEAVPFIVFALSRGLIPPALTVMEILSVDLGTDMLPALALGAEPPEPGVMDRPPRNLKDHVITRDLLLRAYGWLGLPQSIATMAAFYFMYWTNGYWGQWINLPGGGWLYRAATTMALAAVVCTQIGNVFTQRSDRISFFKLRLFNNRLLWAGVASELLLIFGITYLPFLQNFIGTAAFPLRNWLFLFALTPTLLIVDEIRKLWVRRTAK